MPSILKTILPAFVMATLAPRMANATTESVIYSFKGGSDGANPGAGLISAGGILYGTTSAGGSAGEGTVFSVTDTGDEAVTYAFKGGSDGATPVAQLLSTGKYLYGTTQYGGASNDGTVFRVKPKGGESVVYSFAGGADGANPRAGLTKLGKLLYGTTYYGGTSPCSAFNTTCGTVFSLSTSGSEAVLHSFQGGAILGNDDGAYPYAGLIDIHGTLYGTASYGGSGPGNGETGIVYAITPAGVQTVLYSFKSGSDGVSPRAGLLDIHGTLYGTTAQSGNDGGSGTVFSLSPAGTETVLHNFNGPSDGATPLAGLIKVGDKLFGTTEYGGSYGDGTVFSISLKGVETVLYAFKGGADGANPLGGLVSAGGALYGTTNAGGSAGLGTIFKIIP